jgi:ketosteroid isomerase-like protein
MTAEKIKSNDKEEVKKAILDFFSALTRKDIKAMMSCYAPDVVVFDCKPPFQTRGAVAWRHTWEACLPYFPDQFTIDTRDVVIHVDSHLAIAHYLFRVVTNNKEHDAAQTWMRATTGFKFQQGKWKIVHEHGSLPFNPHTAQAIFTLEP